MFEHIKRVFLLLCLAGGASLCLPDFAYAETFSVEAKSAAEFIKNYGDKDAQELLSVLSGKKGTGTKIVCGSTRNLCDTATQVCLKCEYNKTDRFGTTYYEKGRCVSLDKLNRTNLRENWPEDTDCPVSYSDDEGATTFKGISISDSGFNETTTERSVVTSKSKTTITKNTFKGTDGQKYVLYMTDTPTIHYAGDAEGKKDFKGCEVLPVKVYNHQRCFFCPLAALVFSAANNVTISSFSTFAPSFKVVIVVIFAIWLALAALGQLFSMTKQDAPKFLSAILKQGFKFALIFILLGNSGYLFSKFIIPVLASGLNMGTGIQAIELPTPDPAKYHSREVGTPLSYYNQSLGKVVTKDDEGQQIEKHDTLYNRMELFLASTQMQLSYMQAIGTTIFCVGSHEIITINLDKLKTGLRMMFLGGILTAFGFLLTIAFAFYFIDAILQLAILGAMMPFMIAGWPFRATAQYASTGFGMLLHAFFVMFFTGFVISVNIELINQGLNVGVKINEENVVVDDNNTGGFQPIITAINEQNIEKLNQATDIGGVGFLLLAFSCIFGFKFVAQTEPLASKLSGGGLFKGGIATKIGTMAASTTKGMAVKALKPSARALGGMAADGMVGLVGIPGKLGGAVGKMVAGKKQDGKSWKERSFRGKVGMAIGEVASWPHALAKRVRDASRESKK